MIAMNKEWQFGRCPVCNAITSLDATQNKLCDRCHSERWTPYWQDYKQALEIQGILVDDDEDVH